MAAAYRGTAGLLVFLQDIFNPQGAIDKAQNGGAGGIFAGSDEPEDAAEGGFVLGQDRIPFAAGGRLYLWIGKGQKRLDIAFDLASGIVRNFE